MKKLTFFIRGTIGKCFLERDKPVWRSLFCLRTVVSSITNHRPKNVSTKLNGFTRYAKSIWYCVNLRSNSKSMCSTSFRHFSTCLYQYWSVHILFSYFYRFSKIGNQLFPTNQPIQQCLATVFRRIFLELRTQHDEVAILILAWVIRFYYLECSKSFD